MEGENHKNTFRPIDIREIVSSKNPKAAKRIPGFVYNWLKKILHLKEVDYCLNDFGHLKGIPFVNEIIKFLNIKYEISGFDNIPEDGRFFFVSNHPLGGLDGVILLKILNENNRSTRTINNDFVMAVKPMEEWFVPVNKVGGQARESVQIIDELYNSNDNILIFPAGLCSRKIKGKIIDLKWHKHFIQRSIKHKIDIVPIFFEGFNSNRFYNLARIRKFFKIKFNIEMMYLVDEMLKHKNKTFKIYFGKPIPNSTFDKSKKHIEWATKVKEEVYCLSKKG